MELCDMTALELGAKLRTGDISPADAIQAAQMRITARANLENAFLTLLPGPEQPGRGEGPLWGVPMALKDNISTKGIRTTCASRMLAQYVPPYDATVVRRLKAGGAVLLGKLNMDEFAMGSTSETSFFGPVRNPWDMTRSPGGSSGGSAAAVAAGECWYTLGSDTGGSVRQPAAHCGVTGMKPTYGAVSRYGLVAYASSMEQIGPLARTAADCAAVLDLLLGRDPSDATSVDLPGGPLLDRLDGDLRGVRVGIPGSCFASGLSAAVARAVLTVGEVIRSRGAVVEWCELPLLSQALPAYYVLACAEASSNLSRYDGVRYGFHSETAEDLESLYRQTRDQAFGAETKRRILLGTFVLSSKHYEGYYRKAQQTRAQLKESLKEAYGRYDLLLLPTVADTAPVLGESLGDPLSMYLSDLYTVPANLVGLPAISVPCGLDGHGMPIGAQLMGAAYADALVLNAAHGFQIDTVHHRRRPGEGGRV